VLNHVFDNRPNPQPENTKPSVHACVFVRECARAGVCVCARALLLCVPRIGEVVTPDVPLEALPNSSSDQAQVVDEDGRLTAVRVGPEREHEMERSRKVRECIAVALEQLRSQESTSRGNESGVKGGADELLRSLVKEEELERESRNLTVPSWAAVGTRAQGVRAGPALHEEQHGLEQPQPAQQQLCSDKTPMHEAVKDEGQGASERVQRIDLHRLRTPLADAGVSGEQGCGADARSALPLDVQGFCDKYSSGLLAEPALLQQLLQVVLFGYPKP
jgi:hypothetical protein